MFLKPGSISRYRQQHDNGRVLLLALSSTLRNPQAQISGPARRAAIHDIAAPILCKTIFLLSEELLALGIFGAGTGIQSEMINAVKFLEQLIRGFPFTRNGTAHAAVDAFGGFHKLGQGDPRLQSWEELPVHILSIK